MLAWLSAHWHEFDAWMNAPVSARTVWLVVGVPIIFWALVRVTVWYTSRKVIRDVFGANADLSLPTLGHLARQAREEQETYDQEMAQMRREWVAYMRANLSAVRSRQIPLTFLVDTPEGQRYLETLLNRMRGDASVQVAPRRRNEPEPDPASIVPAPTAWDRILQNDDEEGVVCPKKEPETPPTPPVSPKKRPRKKATS
jgi:hypothetical protein